MNYKEKQSVEKLSEKVTELVNQNIQHKKQITELVEKLNQKVDQKKIPLEMEKRVLSSVENAIHESLIKALTGYNNPLEKIAHSVVEEYSESISSIIRQKVGEEIDSLDFKALVGEEFRKKLSKAAIAGADGVVDKEFNKLKKDPVFRSKLTIAINNLIESHV